MSLSTQSSLDPTRDPNRDPAHGTAREARPAASRRYALVTPCRDEAQYARRTLDCVVNQSVKPALWVIVDDGSRDSTPAILAEYASKHPFIKVVRREDRGFRKLGGGVIDAFYAGLDHVVLNEFEYVCKLDLDLDLPANYFESMMRRMEADPRLGTCSGKPFFYDRNDELVSEACGDENSVGMVKFYRVECFRQIGGFVRELMWDGIDCHTCRMKGWLAASWDNPEINFVHLRPMGTSDKNWWKGRVRHGIGQWFMGTSPLYMFASALYRSTRPPIVLGGIAMLWGYTKSAALRKPRYGDPAFRKFLRDYQWASLWTGKKAATRRVNDQQASAWHGASSEANAST